MDPKASVLPITSIMCFKPSTSILQRMCTFVRQFNIIYYSIWVNAKLDFARALNRYITLRTYAFLVNMAHIAVMTSLPVANGYLVAYAVAIINILSVLVIKVKVSIG